MIVMRASWQLRDWILAYSTEHHGCSLHTAYGRLAECGPNILMVRLALPQSL